MKNTVDLTIKRDFNNIDDDNILNQTRRTINFQMTGNKSDLPWRSSIRRVENDRDLSIQFGGLYRESDYYNENILIVGNKEDRKEFRFKQKLNLDICERCGKDLAKIPWKRSDYLCKNCVKELKYDKPERIPWKNIISQNIEYRICWKKGGIRINGQ